MVAGLLFPRFALLCLFTELMRRIHQSCHFRACTPTGADHAWHPRLGAAARSGSQEHVRHVAAVCCSACVVSLVAARRFYDIAGVRTEQCTAAEDERCDAQVGDSILRERSPAASTGAYSHHDAAQVLSHGWGVVDRRSRATNRKMGSGTQSDISITPLQRITIASTGLGGWQCSSLAEVGVPATRGVNLRTRGGWGASQPRPGSLEGGRKACLPRAASPK